MRGEKKRGARRMSRSGANRTRAIARDTHVGEVAAHQRQEQQLGVDLGAHAQPGRQDGLDRALGALAPLAYRGERADAAPKRRRHHHGGHRAAATAARRPVPHREAPGQSLVALHAALVRRLLALLRVSAAGENERKSGAREKKRFRLFGARALT